jgi:hypothetical protein
MAAPAPVAIDTKSLDALIAQAAAGGAAGSGNFAWTVPGTPSTLALGTAGPVWARAPATLAATAKPGSFNLDNVGPVLQQMTGEQFTALQKQLYAIGAYPASYYGDRAKPVNFGKVGDLDTLQAFYAVAPYASRTGNLDQILAASTDISALGAQGPVKQPLVIELPSTDDLHAVLKAAAMPLIGRDPTPEEMDAFTARFQKLSADYQRSAYAAGGSGLPGGPGGTVSKPPSGSAAAETFLQERAPVEAGAQKEENALGILFKMFGGGG